MDKYSYRKQLKEGGFDNSSDDDSESDRIGDGCYENETESDVNSRKRKHDEKKREQISAKVSPNKMPNKIKRAMSSREVDAYCENPENTSVRDKLYAKKTLYNVPLMISLQQRFSLT